MKTWATFVAQQAQGQHVHEAPGKKSKGGYFLQQLGYATPKHDVQPDIYNPHEPCRARIVPTSGSPMVPNNNKEDQRPPVVIGETAAASGAKPAARVQPMSVLLGVILKTVLLQ